MILQVIGGVVRSANCGHTKLLENPLGGQLRRGQGGVCFFPYSPRTGFVEWFVNAEVAFEFEMGPVIERISQSMWDGPRPGPKLGKRLGISSTEFLRHSV